MVTAKGIEKITERRLKGKNEAVNGYLQIP